MKKFIIILISMSFCSCATLSNREKTLISMGGSAIVGSIIGLATSPKDGSSPVMHSLYLGAVGASIAGVTGLYLFDDHKKTQSLEKQLEAQQKQMNALRDDGGTPSPVLMHETNAPLGRDIPPEYKKLVKPGRWSVYGLDQWITQGDGVLIHQDKMLKLIPPSLNPVSE